MKVLKKNKGFTLVELIVVIAIIGVLAAVLIPSLTRYIGSANESAAKQDALSMYQELLSEVDPISDSYTTLTQQKYYVVLSGDYCVLLEGGAAKGIVKVNNMETAIETFKTSYASVTQYFTLAKVSDKYEVAQIKIQEDGSLSLPTIIYPGA